MENTCSCMAKHKHTPRSEEEIKNLKSRINRIVGQLNGVAKMLDDNRYCGDILTQLLASEAALKQVAYIILKNHMETCLVEDIKNDKKESIDELIELLERFK